MNIGTIGTGLIVETFLDAVRETRNVKCTAVFSRKEETARILADKYQVKQIYTDYEAMLLDKNIGNCSVVIVNTH